MLKGAIIGFGEVAQKGHWPGYQGSRDAKIVAVVDRTEQRRKIAEKVIPGSSLATDAEQLLDHIIGNADDLRRRLEAALDQDQVAKFL